MTDEERRVAREARRQERLAAREAALDAKRAENAAKRAAIIAARQEAELEAREARASAASASAAAALRLRQLARVEEVDGLPRVLLIGDSISMGYTLEVRRLLPEANVQRIPNNGSDTGTDLGRIPGWLAGFGDKPWDVIHYNSGIHDAIQSDGAPRVSLEQYAANLRQILILLKATGAKLIFATTTPAPAGDPRYGDHVAYNDVAVPIMQENGVAIDDLYSLVAPRFEELAAPNNVHFLPASYDTVLAPAVAASISEQL